MSLKLLIIDQINDSEVLSLSLRIPVGAVRERMKMRIIGLLTGLEFFQRRNAAANQAGGHLIGGLPEPAGCRYVSPGVRCLLPGREVIVVHQQKAAKL